MSRNTLHHDEGGRISIYFVFGTIAFIFLVALIYNTAHQSIRKIEMQGAADAAAIAGGTQAARDLSDIANNNNTMSEVLTVMITFRSLLQTVEVMRAIAFVAATATTLLPPVAAALKAIETALRITASVMKPIDRALSEPSRGGAWITMKAMDTLNIGIKTDFPIWSELETRDFAKRNGADRGLNGVLIPRESPARDLLPWLPAARGRHLEILERAEATYLKYVQPLPGGVAAIIAFVFPNPVTIF